MPLNPCRHPPAGRLELLPCRTPLDARHALPIWSPSKLKAQKREAPLHAGVKTAEAQQAGLFGCDLEVEFLQPLWKYPVEPLCILLIAESTDPVSRPGESHPQALSEPDMNVSAHPAPIIQPRV
jgi:hypothetical protein